jgi:hypothetical protein
MGKCALITATGPNEVRNFGTKAVVNLLTIRSEKRAGSAIAVSKCGSNSVGRVTAFQAVGRGFESRLPLLRFYIERITYERSHHIRMFGLQDAQLRRHEEQTSAQRTRGVQKVLLTLQQTHGAQRDEITFLRL